MDEAFTQIDFGPLKQYLENDDITDISYSNNGQVWLKTLSQGVYRVENTGINNSINGKNSFPVCQFLWVNHLIWLIHFWMQNQQN